MTATWNRHPAERLVDLVAAGALGAAGGWAGVQLAFSPALAAAVAALALGLGWTIMRTVGEAREAPASQSLVPQAFEECIEDDALLLDDPLVNIGDDSRVVRLFARDPSTPGEMAARIDDFLKTERQSQPASSEAFAPQPADASAALHAALANIRASLR